MLRNPTMKDVAHEAGVSLKTVSRHVNGETNIDPGLAERISAAIAKLGYRRNLSAASIRPGRTGKTIGLVISDLANPYYSTLARAIESVADAAGYLVTIASSEEDGRRHDRLVDRLLEQRVDGLIVVPPRRATRDWSEVAAPIPPLVVLDRPVPYGGADAVLADNAGGARAATLALVAGGARRIAFVGDSPDIYTMRERHAGYAAALAEAGPAAGAPLTITTAHTREQAEREVGGVLRDGRADALFTANNRATIGALLAFRTAGRRVPLVGFDDFETALLGDPPVSVVSQDVELMGRTAAGLVLGRLNGDTSAFATRVLPTRLILRGSERPPAGRGSAG
ncbi:LacI family transcriptional regulator [Nonomuraea sp. MG754425]|uniref:LacI family DNA-binding transcriptional regulator n=1 Tax=Nonomuraea sp. MG754425 TaxID=2570319 RepID=UPI001F415184|nr:LacI family DNA-binding transcriptional regulator [Nonomuraea sp. MG754425]MCF6470870.1 LacI family transcriptional regulator [Nonomuraea sp. MG754425]